jgi:hypothetical protein
MRIGETPFADVDLLGKIKLTIDGKAKINIEFAGESLEGALVLSGGLNYYVGPEASVGENAKDGGEYADSCIAMKSGNDEAGVKFSVYAKDENGRDWTRDLKGYSIPARKNVTECIGESSVDINGNDE